MESLDKACFKVSGITFCVYKRYRIKKVIGRSASGITVSALDTATGNLVAIKKFERLFESGELLLEVCKSLKILHYLRHENIVLLEKVFYTGSQENFTDVYAVYEYMDTDLQKVITSPQPLTNDHHKYFIYQILRGLKYVHSANISINDLKPFKIYLNRNSDLKLSGFDLATPFNFHSPVEFISNRWYYSPEQLTNSFKNCKKIDIWGLGCVFACLLKRAPLFRGASSLNQIEAILDVLGTPQNLDFIESSDLRERIISLPHYEKQDFKTLIPGVSEDALDLLSKMLVFNPDKRWSVEECLSHSYLSELHFPEDEPTAEEPFDWSCLETRDLRSIIHNLSVSL